MNAPVITHTDLSGIDEALRSAHSALRHDVRGRRRIALMELSSGAVKILVPRLSPHDMLGRFDFANYNRFSVNVPLSEGITEGGTMDVDFFAYSVLPHIRQLSQDAVRHGVTDIYTIATATYRQITNRDEILEMIACDCGLNVSVLTPAEEACGVANAIVMSLPLHYRPTFVIDHGKRSTEITLIHPDGQLDVLSLDFGLTHLLAGFSTINKLDTDLESILYPGLTKLMSVAEHRLSRPMNVQLVGIGTPITLSTGLRGARNYHGLTLSLSDLEYIRLHAPQHLNEPRHISVGLAPYITLIRLLTSSLYPAPHITVSGTSLWYGALHRALTLFSN